MACTATIATRNGRIGKRALVIMARTGDQNHASVTQAVNDTIDNEAQANCRGPTRSANGATPPSV